MKFDLHVIWKVGKYFEKAAMEVESKGGSDFFKSCLPSLPYLAFLVFSRCLFKLFKLFKQYLY